MRTTDKRFWVKVQKTDTCWEWIGAKNRPNGHGLFRNGEKLVLAHRFSWMLHKGEIPEEMLVCHHCDSPSCVRPDHLFLGGHLDNMIDAAKKGRFGQLHCKLTKEQAKEMRSLYDSGNYTQRQLGRMFGVSQTTVFRAVRYKTFYNVD